MDLYNAIIAKVAANELAPPPGILRTHPDMPVKVVKREDKQPKRTRTHVGAEKKPILAGLAEDVVELSDNGIDAEFDQLTQDAEPELQQTNNALKQYRNNQLSDANNPISALNKQRLIGVENTENPHTADNQPNKHNLTDKTALTTEEMPEQHNIDTWV